jgi:hypothetical protein
MRKIEIEVNSILSFALSSLLSFCVKPKHSFLVISNTFETCSPVRVYNSKVTSCCTLLINYNSNCFTEYAYNFVIGYKYKKS